MESLVLRLTIFLLNFSLQLQNNDQKLAEQESRKSMMRRRPRRRDVQRIRRLNSQQSRSAANFPAYWQQICSPNEFAGNLPNSNPICCKFASLTVVPRSPFVLTTAQPPHSHMENATCAGLYQLGLTALRATVDVEPYGSSDLGGNPSDNQLPSLSSALPSKDDDCEDLENPSYNRKTNKRKGTRHERCRSKEAKAIATSKIVVNLPKFWGKDLSKFAESLDRFLRMTSRPTLVGG